jgi:hypothetical protein
MSSRANSTYEFEKTALTEEVFDPYQLEEKPVPPRRFRYEHHIENGADADGH